jgi:hypothetical protein
VHDDTDYKSIKKQQQQQNMTNKNKNKNTINKPLPLLLQNGVCNLELYSQKFKFENNLFQIASPLPNQSLDEFIKSLNIFLEDLNLVNHKGYVTPNTVPISFFPLITKFLNNLGYKGCIGRSERTIQLWLNLIIVNLYFISILKEKELQQNVDPLLFDQIDDFKNIIQKLYSLLDPSIRLKIQKRGISVIQNIYTGYDSEFVLKDVRKHLNELLSLQLALNTRTIVKIPLYKPYEISYVHPLTNKVSYYSNPSKSLTPLENNDPLEDLDSTFTESIFTESGKESLQKTKSKSININSIELELLQNSISYTIEQIRGFKYNIHDYFLFELIETLKTSPGIIYFEDILKDQIVFVLPRTNIIKKVIYRDPNNKNIKEYSFEYLVKTSNLLANSSLIDSYNQFIQYLRASLPSLQKENFLGTGNGDIIKSRQRTTYNISPLIDSLGGKTEVEKISVSRIKINYFCSHLTNADLSILSDFNTLKTQLDIVNKSFITLGKSLLIDNSNVHIRDTMLLAPAGNRSLESLGKLYSCKKLDLSLLEKENMDLLLQTDRHRFEEYAQQDAVITLKHANAMEDFNIRLKEIGVPITLASLGRKYVLSKWRESLPPHTSRGYQISPEISIGNSESVQTPKGLNEIGNIGVYMSYYIANYKGGRNESFMYGVDNNTIWYDYDLISAYTTSMADLGLPSYLETSLITQSEMEKWDLEKLLNNYIIIKGAFKFPLNTKFPSIPCFVDSQATTTVYPLTGQCFLTGPEYLLCKLQGCEIKIESIINTPYKTFTTEIGFNNKISQIIKPFQTIIAEVQSLRKEYPKGDIMNLLYKEMGNSIYGNVVRGIANKRKFDIKTGRNLRIDSTELSNPILASRTTGFIRSVIGECLHNISKLGGQVVSVTTDGFITDVKDLETKLLNLNSKEIPLFSKYREIRETLSGTSTALEIKHSGKGIIS